MSKKEVQSIVCNDSHVFLSLKTGVESVFGLLDAAWVTDLAPGEGKPSEISGCAPPTRVAVGEDMVISAAWGKVVTLWSSKADMDKIFTFNILKYNPTASVEMLGRRGGKVILFTDKGLFVLERAADGGWEHSVIPDLLDFSAMSVMIGDPVTEDRMWTALEMVGASKWGGVGDSKVLLWNRAEKQMVEEPL